MGSGKRIARQAESMNALMAEMLLSTDLDQYRMDKPPAAYRIVNLIRYAPSILWRLRPLFKWLLMPVLRRERFQKEYDAALSWFEEWVNRPIDHDEPLR